MSTGNDLSGIANGAFKTVFDENPQFDLLRADFHDREFLALLKIDEAKRPETINKLKAFQRHCQLNAMKRF